MRSYSTVPIVVLGLTTIFAVGSLAAPAQTHAAGLDFWNIDDEWTGFRDAETAGHDLDFGLEQAQLRNAVSDDIAVSLCEDRITAPEALETLGTLVESFPGWIVQLRSVYRHRGDIVPMATDHDVLARYLHARIVSLIWKAEVAGDRARAAALSVRLIRFDRESHE